MRGLSCPAAGVVKGAAFIPERWRQRACGGKPSYSRRVYSATEKWPVACHAACGRENRYPIDVVKIPMAVPLTTAFKQNIERIRRERLPKELGHALQHQLRMVIKR